MNKNIINDHFLNTRTKKSENDILSDDAIKDYYQNGFGHAIRTVFEDPYSIKQNTTDTSSNEEDEDNMNVEMEVGYLDNQVKTTNSFQALKSPQKPNWKLTFSKDDLIQFNFVSGPNWFHRLMQKLVFGFVWEKIKHD